MGSSWTSVCSTAPSIPLRNCFGSSTSAPTPRMRRARSVWEPRCSGRLAVVATRVPLCSTNSQDPRVAGLAPMRSAGATEIHRKHADGVHHPSALVEFSYHPVDDPAAVQPSWSTPATPATRRTPDLSPSSPTPAVLLPEGPRAELFRPHRRGSVTRVTSSLRLPLATPVRPRRTPTPTPRPSGLTVPRRHRPSQ